MSDKTPAIRTDDASLIEADRHARDARERFLTGFRARFAPGKPVSWVYGSRDEVQQGVVLSNGHHDRLMVRNNHGGAEYWIRGWRVMEAMRRE